MVYMTLAQRDRIRSILTAILLLTVGLTLLFRLRLAPMAEQLIVTQVDNQASDAINAAIDEQITSGEIDYDRMISVEKDAEGNVNALHTNIAEVNRLKRKAGKPLDGGAERTHRLCPSAGAAFGQRTEDSRACAGGAHLRRGVPQQL